MNRENLKIAIADSSMIIRSGISVTLKRVPGFKIQPVEIAAIDMLYDYVRMHKPDILIVNPVFLGYFDILKFKTDTGCVHMKCIALICSVMDHTLWKNYDGSITLYDGPDQLRDMLNRLSAGSPGESAAASDTLSNREKEIIVCVVKGMTNKEIAEALFLSTHTVITHRRNITRKLQIHSSSGLTIYAIVNKLVELNDIK